MLGGPIPERIRRVGESSAPAATMVSLAKYVGRRAALVRDPHP